MFIDARIPVLLSPGDLQDAAVLVEGTPLLDGAAGVRFDLACSHAPGCACCRPRGPVADALSSLFTRRARGELAFFRVVRVLELSDAGRDAVLDALANDPVASARLRLG